MIGLAVGRSLSAIREGALYSVAGYETFDAYCRDRWGFSEDFAIEIIDAFRSAEAAPCN